MLWSSSLTLVQIVRRGDDAKRAACSQVDSRGVRLIELRKSISNISANSSDKAHLRS